MPITAKQLELRKNHIGSSDMAAILGSDAYRSAFDVFLEKTGQLTEQKENKQMYAGSMFESGVLDYAEQELGKLKRNYKHRAPGFSTKFPVVSHVDAIIMKGKIPVEAKTSGLFGPLNPDWGEPGSNEIPMYVFIQAQTHMLCCDAEICYIPTFLAGRGFQMFIVKRRERLVQAIRDVSVDFWSYVLAYRKYICKHKEEEEAPLLPDSRPTMRAISHMIRVPRKIVNISEESVELWHKAKVVKRMADLAERLAQEKVLALLGDAEVGQSEAGTVTYKEQSRKEYTVKATTYRVARLSNTKELPAAKIKTLNKGKTDV